MGMPLVALQGQPPPQQDMLGEAGKAMQLSALKGQIAEQPGQLQLQQQQIETQQRQLADKKARTAALQEWSDTPGSIPQSELPRLILKHGGSADAALDMQKQIVTQQTQLATLDKDKLANAKAHTDAIGAAAQAVLSVSPENRAQAYALKMKELVAQGIAPQTAAQQPYDEGMVKLYAAQSMSAKDQLESEIKKREVAAQELKAQTEAKKLQAEMPGGALQDVSKAEMNDWLAKNPGKGPSDYAAWHAKLAPQSAIAAQGTVDPALASAVANGQMKIGDVLTARMPLPLRQAFLRQVMQINPDFKSYDFDVEKGVAKAFTSGAEAKNLTAFNTAIEHAKQLHGAAEALNIGDVRTLNKIGNALGYEFGSDKTTNFNVIKNALSGEISKVFKGGQATDAEIKAVQEPFDAANSPAQLKGAIRNAIALMNSKRDALKKQYEAGKQAKPNFGEEKPAAGAATHRYNPQTGQIEEIKP